MNIKNFMKIWVPFVAVLLSMNACKDAGVSFVPEPEIPEGYELIKFNATIPEMTMVQSRAVDPDGVDVSNMTLFCFNAYGVYLSTAQASLVRDNTTPTVSGTFEAVIPSETYIIHFVANQPAEMYSDVDLRGRTEDQIQSTMEGAAGMIIYWARFESDGSGSIDSQLAAMYGGENKLELLRNQAKVSFDLNGDGLNDEWTANEHFVITGFVVTNIHAFGTIAPYHPEKRFPTKGTDFEWPGDEAFVTLPLQTGMMSDITAVNIKNEDYIFEHENTTDNPVSVIIRGYNKSDASKAERYYRAMIINAEGELMPVRRNHHYIMNITGELTYGSDTFEKALEGPATNNVWATVDNWVDEVSDGTKILSVEKTGVVLGEEYKNKAYLLKYKLTDMLGNGLSEGASVKWLDGNNVAQNAFSHSYDTNTGEGIININVLDIASDKEFQTGTLLVKSGLLQRTIEVVMIKTQKLTPCWVGTQIFGGETGQFVTVKFTVPESTPDIMFPFSVLVSVNALDVRYASGMEPLPIVKKGDPAYFGNDYEGINYKYEFVVTKPGVQRMYFQNILTFDDGAVESLHLEAKFFETVDKTYRFSEKEYAVTVKGLNEYSIQDGDDFADDEKVYYLLVPQKINSPVIFDMVMLDKATNRAINAGANDEFLLYSKSLDYYQDDELDDDLKDILGVDAFDCDFYPIDENYWQTSTNGRVMMFMPRNPAKVGGEVGHYSIYLRTNRAVSEDVVRISSNVNDGVQLSAHPDKAGQVYAGESYRSMIFELANYRPFRFAAKINGEGNYGIGWTDSEPETDLLWTYEPNQAVNIELDITSFEGSDGKSADPFGTEFEIFIDAPMLEMVDDMGGKLRKDSNVEGRFIYMVDADRDMERTYGSGPALYTDNVAGVNQAGERKVLKFRTNTITSMGEIKLSSNKERVVYYDQVFNVRNELITGNIHYTDDNVTKIPVPKDAFVSFALKRNGVRIGSMTIVEDGKYTLNLRKEYSFGWTNDPLELEYITLDGNVYDNDRKDEENFSLSDIFANGDIILTPAESI